MDFVRVDLLLVARPGVTQQALGQGLADGARAITSQAGGQVALRVAIPAAGADRAPAAAGQANSAAARFDAVVSSGCVAAGSVAAGSVAAASARLSAAVTKVASGVSDLIDHASSAALSGSVTVIVPGEGPYFTLYPLRRISSMSAIQFHDYWLNQHGSLARTLPGLSGYRQFHADPHQTAELARTLGFGVSDFEGCAEGRRTTLSAAGVRHGPELEAVLADEKNFIDLARCGPTLYQAIFGSDAFGG